jgi:porin
MHDSVPGISGGVEHLEFWLPPQSSLDKLQTNYKLGVWYHTAPLSGQRFDTGGGLLASPMSSAVPQTHSGDFGVYGVADHILWRREGTKDQGIGGFLHVQAGPSDRNLSDWFVAGGVNWNGPFQDRSDDVAGLAVSYLGISPAAQRFSRDLVSFGRAKSVYASNETVIEATYQAPVTKWLTLQPDAQLVLNPNAGIPNSFGRIPHSPAFVIGLRATIKLSHEDKAVRRNGAILR